jgi:chemotaxis protein CheD
VTARLITKTAAPPKIAQKRRLGNVVVGISDMQVSKRPGDLLVTYSLGSCLGVTFYDPQIRVGAMIHCMLPLSKVDPARAKTAPYMFVDTGIPALYRKFMEMGAKKNRLIVKAAGCSQLLDDKKLFMIGKRNFTVFRKMLWKNNILISGEHIGGSLSRTMFLDIVTGEVTVRVKDEEVVL